LHNINLFLVEFLQDIADWAVSQNKKGLSPFYLAIWPYLIFLVLKILPIKDTLSLYRDYPYVGL